MARKCTPPQPDPPVDSVTAEDEGDVGSPRRPRGLSSRAIWWLAFGVFGAWSTLWAFSLPPTFPVDEAAHTVKAVAVVRGELQTTVRKEPRFGGGLIFPET